MAVSAWLRPPRYLVILLIGITLILMGALAWLGWRLFQQDRVLEQQRVEDRLQRAADLVALELDRRLREVEDHLTQLSTTPTSDLPQSAAQYADEFSDDAVVAVFGADGVSAYPDTRLIYHPGVPSVDEPQARVFTRGHAHEVRDQDYAAAAREFRQMAQSQVPAVRASALLGLGRVERKAGRTEAALEAFAALAELEAARVDGLPADLVARCARLRTLAESLHADDVRREAQSIYDDLHAGRWPLTWAQHAFHEREVCRWIGCTAGDSAVAASPFRSMHALAEGVDQLRARRLDHETGRELAWIEGYPVLLVWRGSPERTVGLVGGLDHLERDWLVPLQPLLGRNNLENVAVELANVRSEPLTSRVREGTTLRATRGVAQTGLPWTLSTVSADPDAEFAQFAERRRLAVLGLVTVALLILVGLYAVMRGVTRELEVARLQSDFVSAVSHDLRTPLTSLRQLTEMLSSGRVTTAERRARYYRVMARESGRLHRLVDELLDFGRMEAGALEFEWSRVRVDDLARDVVEEFSGEIASAGYTIELSNGGASAPVRADAEALGRALWNLLDNAVKYSPGSKTLWVDVMREDGHVAIAVRDRGLGISPDEQKAIFAKFVRGASSEQYATEGTGIGLAMVQHIVEAHGGEVRVESDVGKGSTFTIVLPVEE